MRGARAIFPLYGTGVFFIAWPDLQARQHVQLAGRAVGSKKDPGALTGVLLPDPLFRPKTLAATEGCRSRCREAPERSCSSLTLQNGTHDQTLKLVRVPHRDLQLLVRFYQAGTGAFRTSALRETAVEEAVRLKEIEPPKESSRSQAARPGAGNAAHRATMTDRVLLIQSNYDNNPTAQMASMCENEKDLLVFLR